MSAFPNMSDKKKPLKTKGCRTIFTKPHFFVAIAKRFAIVRSSPVSATNTKPSTTMKITITSSAINNGKQHIIRIPFVGTFTVDQKDRNRACAFVLANNRKDSLSFMQSIAIA